jgi:hypothetical protein
MLLSPSTPSSRLHSCDPSFAHIPAKSSPLTSSETGGSSPIHSPTLAASERRRSQYKSRGEASSPTLDRRQASRRVSKSAGAGGAVPFALTRNDQHVPTEEPPRKTMLRERFRARCIERANRDRERVAQGKRRAVELSSDGADEFMDCEDDEEDDETVMNDPVCLEPLVLSASVNVGSCYSSSSESCRISSTSRITTIVYRTMTMWGPRSIPILKTSASGRRSSEVGF